MTNDDYVFSPEAAFQEISEHWKMFMAKLCCSKCAIAISGGKDSTIVAALAAKAFGKENVIGIMLPCDVQADIADSQRVCSLYCGKALTINIGEAFHSILEGIENEAVEVSAASKTNLPPRLRMAATYAVAQSMDAIPINTSNLTEDILGYATLWGDTTGSYAPIQGLTVTEVLQLGDWLGVPYDLVHKVPADGLQSKTDEENLGMKYADVDRLIRKAEGTPEFKLAVYAKHRANKFKLDMIHLPGPKFLEYPNYARLIWK